jgi:hypothetical protein
LVRQLEDKLLGAINVDSQKPGMNGTSMGDEPEEATSYNGVY